jgi:hypothetical protein
MDLPTTTECKDEFHCDESEVDNITQQSEDTCESGDEGQHNQVCINGDLRFDAMY